MSSRSLDWRKYVHWPLLFLQSVLEQMAVCNIAISSNVLTYPRSLTNFNCCSYHMVRKYRINMPDVGWKQHLGDLANTLKAFVGTNYLSLAYGFNLAGLGVSSTVSDFSLFTALFKILQWCFVLTIG